MDAPLDASNRVQLHRARCPICGCIPAYEFAHEVQSRANTGYRYLVTCSSEYCKVQDDIRTSHHATPSERWDEE